MTSDLQPLATLALNEALNRGAKQAAVRVLRRREVALAWRDGQIERSADSTERGLTARIFLGGRYSAHRTSDLRPSALASFIAEAVDLTGLLSPEGERGLPDPRLYEGRREVDLGVLDPGYEDVTADDRRRWLRTMEEGARSVPGAARIASVGATSSDERRDLVQLHSDGFRGVHSNTLYQLTVSISCRGLDGRRPEDWNETTACRRDALVDPARVGADAALRALEFAEAVAVRTGRQTVVVEPRCGGRLLRWLLQALDGGNLRQRKSFLEGRQGTRIAAPVLSVTDDPFLPGGLASRTFDWEGLALRRLPLIEAGTLRNCYLDTWSATRLRMAPTTGESTNVVLAPGDRPLAGLLADVREGVLVTGFLGGNSNETTGDFSLGLRGFTIREGRKGPAMAEVNLVGNHLDLWTRLAAVGNDPNPNSSLRTPTLVFDGLQLAGA